MANSKTISRCVNLDWVEVYVLENRDVYPCDAEYYRKQGYFVREREYGTRQYSQMFTIEDTEGQPWIEVRRAPQSGNSSFVGLVPESSHIRLVNRACYDPECIRKLCDFLARHQYLFQRISRIDVCYDFIRFDSGDYPAKFARRYIERKYRKINQADLFTHGHDNWADFDWNSLSWGNPKSMVSTKLYNKSLEMSRANSDKPYIRYAWFVSGLIDNPVDGTRRGENGKIEKPDVWRVEFSMKSAARNWIVIEDSGQKHNKPRPIPHTLALFDAPDKLWARFQDLAYHYFRFKEFEYKKDKNGKPTKEPQRKDRCKDKKLFDFSSTAVFHKLDTVPRASHPSTDDEVLRKRLSKYKLYHLDPQIQKACDILLRNLTRTEVARLTSGNTAEEIETLQRVIALRMKYPEVDALKLAAELAPLIASGEIF